MVDKGHSINASGGGTERGTPGLPIYVIIYIVFILSLGICIDGSFGSKERPRGGEWRARWARSLKSLLLMLCFLRRTGEPLRMDIGDEEYPPPPSRGGEDMVARDNRRRSDRRAQ